MSNGFGSRLARAMDLLGHVCVGIDPHPQLLEEWQLPDDPEGLRQLTLRTVESVSGVAPVVKPQSALFERHGAAGIAVLEELIRACRELSLLCIVDAKRGDIGSTMKAYADAYLGGGPLTGDAVTLSPFLGFGSLSPAVDMAEERGGGVFVLALTSNPEGNEVQDSRDSNGVAVAAAIASHAQRSNEAAITRGETLGSVGLVVGATIGTRADELGIDLAAVKGPLLAPGVGAQGAGPQQIKDVFGDARKAVLVSSSRGILRAGPDKVALRDATRQCIDEVASALGI